jgi:hypothetical protein
VSVPDVECEWDGRMLTLHNGLEPACEECQRVEDEHLRECSACRVAPNLPDDITLSTLLTAMGD